MALRISGRALAPSALRNTTVLPATSRKQWVRHYATPVKDQENRTAIVTGSARGIGKAIALRLAQDGYDICINDIPANEPGAKEVVSEIKKLGRNAFNFSADVSNLKEVENLVQASVSELGPLNTMISNAGIAQVKPLLELTEQDFKRMFEVNVYGTFNCYSVAARQMIKQGTGGKLLGAASIVAFKPFALLSHYSASKWAVRGLTQAFAMEMATHKITVNAYAPGIVGTAMWDLIDEKLGELSGAKKGDTIKKYSSELIALGRTSEPEDVAKTVSFLSSPDSDYMTGQTILIDGGIIFT
ncbi:acetoin dehydrogenase-like protein [Aaosphaeria arxii CBS 175.79]|uniref:Acetoin dehydrogenase-like protein n=1 Tax=Aaosphaeria arxii CBS 175.79 TaxID=1450172 RepID=A0A6A5XXC3_9PLEO|nr:acetoin dehydrogenase-like protein [Aaosphaeria arxii CBS 175.79]KAF2017968.1 acetoin dehydrogenase-like protein [Aaosphaeria arxii CBS 175.79]